MTLTTEQLFDFLYCPLFFHTKHILKVPMKNHKEINHYIDTTIKYFYCGILNNELYSYRDIQSKWDTQVKSLNSDSKAIITGWEKVVKIIEWSKAKKIIIADMNCQYHFASGQHLLQGVIDYVAICPNKEIELIYFDLSDKIVNKTDTQHKLKYVMDFFGFQKVYDKMPSRIRIFHVKSGEDSIIIPDQHDYARLTAVVKNTLSIVEQSLYTPRETVLCNSCLANVYCRFFKESEVFDK